MTIYSGIFNSVRDGQGNGDRKYNAWWFAKYFSTFIGNGVFPNPSTNLQIIEGTNMQVIVKPGSGWIDGYFLYSDSDHVLQLDIADGVLKRIDRIVMRLNHLKREIEIVVKKGAFASNPVPPSLQRDTDYHELALADVIITNGATQITQANITDTRLDKTLCGIVHGTVDQVDTTSIFNQYLAWFNETKTNADSELSVFQTQKQEEFETWFDSVKGILEGDVAANLATQISALSERVTALENDSATKQEVQTLSEIVTSHKNDLASQEEGKGASLIGISDNNNLFTATTVEGALNELFTNASNGKQVIGTAITGVNSSLVVPDNPTFEQLATLIGSISTGIPFPLVEPKGGYYIKQATKTSQYWMTSPGTTGIVSDHKGTILKTKSCRTIGENGYHTYEYVNSEYVNSWYDHSGTLIVKNTTIRALCLTLFYLDGYVVGVTYGSSPEWVVYTVSGTSKLRTYASGTSNGYSYGLTADRVLLSPITNQILDTQSLKIVSIAASSNSALGVLGNYKKYLG